MNSDDVQEPPAVFSSRLGTLGQLVIAAPDADGDYELEVAFSDHFLSVYLDADDLMRLHQALCIEVARSAKPACATAARDDLTRRISEEAT